MPPYSFDILKPNYSIAVHEPKHFIYEAVTLYGRSFQSVQFLFWYSPAPHFLTFCKAGFGMPFAAFNRFTDGIAFAFFSCGY